MTSACLLTASLDYFHIRLHIRMERLYHQVLDPRTVSPYLWTLMAGLVLRRFDHWLLNHKPHRTASVYTTFELLLEPMVWI
jgi:hypothetical protein